MWCYLFFFFSVLLHCTSDVWADGGGGSDVAQKTEAPPHEYFNKITEHVEKVGKKLANVFETSSKNADEVLSSLEKAQNSIKSAKESLKGNPQNAETALSNLEQKITEAVSKSNTLKQINNEVFKSKSPDIKQKISELLEKSQELNAAIKSNGSGGDQGSTAADRAGELSVLANKAKTLLEELSEKINKHYTTSSGVVREINDADLEIGKTTAVFSTQEPQEDGATGKVEKLLKEDVQKNITASLQKAGEIQLAYEKAREGADDAVKIFKELAGKSEKIAQELKAATTAGGNNDLSGNLRDDQNKEKITEVVKNLTDKEKKQESGGAVVLSDSSSAAIVPHLFIFIPLFM